MPSAAAISKAADAPAADKSDATAAAESDAPVADKSDATAAAESDAPVADESDDAAAAVVSAAAGSFGRHLMNFLINGSASVTPSFSSVTSAIMQCDFVNIHLEHSSRRLQSSSSYEPGVTVPSAAPEVAALSAAPEVAALSAAREVAASPTVAALLPLSFSLLLISSMHW